MGLYNFVSLFGIVAIIAIACLFSPHRRSINWHAVIWGVGIQMGLAWFLFVFPSGTKFFLWLNDAVMRVMASSIAGAEFMFGPLAVPPGGTGSNGEASLGFILAFQALPTIIFFSALMSLLYFFNIMPRIIQAFSYLFTKLMRVSGAESLCTASNIFVGVESVLTVRPYLKEMTRSELGTVLISGMATVSSNILAFYVFSLGDAFPNIAGHLISASFLSAPAALAISKIVLPETETPKTLGEHVNVYVERDANWMEAIIKGAMTGVQLVVGIGALLIAVLGLVHLLNQGIVAVGGVINQWFSWSFDWSLKSILGIVFYPFALLIGVPVQEAGEVAKILGERLILTEVVGYQDLRKAVAEGLIQEPRTAVITAYALCGFAHLASMGIFLGGISAIVPEKTAVLSRIAWRALLGATLACLLTACVAGVFFVEGSYILRL